MKYFTVHTGNSLASCNSSTTTSTYKVLTQLRVYSFSRSADWWISMHVLLPGSTTQKTPATCQYQYQLHRFFYSSTIYTCIAKSCFCSVGVELSHSGQSCATGNSGFGPAQVCVCGRERMSTGKHLENANRCIGDLNATLIGWYVLFYWLCSGKNRERGVRNLFRAGWFVAFKCFFLFSILEQP